MTPRNPIFKFPGYAQGSHREVRRLRMMDDDRRGRLLGVELVFFGEGDAEVLGAQQGQELLLVGEVWTCRIAERVAATAIALREHRLGVARLLGGKAQFTADALVQVLGKSLGHLDGEAV